MQSEAKLPRRRVLLVEDDVSFRELIATRMRRDAFDVIEAGSGGEALGLVDDDIDLVVLDVNIPGVSGLDIARLLRKCDDATPIVLMTAYPARELAAEAERLGIALLAKPFALDRLSDEAITALSRNNRAVS